MDRVYSKSAGKELTCTNLFQLKIKDVFPIQIDHNKFIKREPIREGGFGLIYSAEWKERKEKVILKYVKSNPNIREFIEVRNFNKEFAQYADGAACESILNTTFRT
ncbi:hypothetical protein GLOIN_2v1472855 [Rhizophagus irregularis DAOM 181602=DAOM 197198]|uniref:Protein kinase domain-containing protein n=1 Tax=Rhizophagus irregularis (strain DAOM 181602 / DAOM 197198 / MUCL 43194) TaxID=747089 RepID=A0A2P4QM57_RHIID|nr:hypothetical protein GLOIN_2v1472855 [Rhizophagus irregularis DAOM 181602=DAOM 197198]POG78733.1 hypothetical protein GLOIN_2v1472855 [Rhizophagus irregularis DAOM 181602=DAOM 197198]|eukprot:XP_025185599.1 hypothetical protein GLOIN_2v1472855 [Rhizophagus irregularis DAOM 181602=DAOM 197198]